MNKVRQVSLALAVSHKLHNFSYTGSSNKKLAIPLGVLVALVVLTALIALAVIVAIRIKRKNKKGIIILT